MKIIKGSFKKESESTLRSKIEKSLLKIEDLHSSEVTGNFVLLTDCNKEIYISSDLPAEEFNFLLDMAKLSVLHSAGIPAN